MESVTSCGATAATIADPETEIPFAAGHLAFTPITTATVRCLNHVIASRVATLIDAGAG